MGFFFYLHILCYFYFLVTSVCWPLISSYHILVGLDRLGPFLGTLCAWSALERQRVLDKLMQPLIGKMKLSVVGYFSRHQHSGKAGLIAFGILLALSFQYITIIVKQIE